MSCHIAARFRPLANRAISLRIVSIALLVAICLRIVDSASLAGDSSVELIRDRWGTPHVFAETDAGAMYGLGYAAAEDRGFQMHYFLRIMQGRLAEVLGDSQQQGRRLTPLQSDKKMRAFGLARAANRVVENLDAETLGMLRGYANGVNDYFAQHQADRHYLFDKLGLEPEPWTPADCVLSWWHMAQFFAHDGLGNRHRREDIEADATHLRHALKFVDDDAAVVQREDVSDEWVQNAETFARDHGLFRGLGEDAADPPKFSHAWVVGGEKTTTGSAVLVSDPQTPVTSPSLFYEFHAQGATFNVRGIGVAGSPMLLIGFTKNVAWGVTALGADQADLFRLKTDPARPNQYQLDGEWRDMDVLTETINVKGGRSVPYEVRTSYFGPVVTDLVRAVSEGDEFALRRVPISITNSETIQAAPAMWRAQDAFALHRAMSGWQVPSANCVFGDSQGNIGFTTLGAMPVPPAHAIDFGRYAHQAHKSEHDWQGMLPHELVPHVFNPKGGALWTANHRVIGKFYPLNIHGSTGESIRSWRLRELLTAPDRFAPGDVLDMHFDSVNPARRDIVRAGLHLQRTRPDRLSGDAEAALAHLEQWHRDGASSALTRPGAELAVLIDTEFYSSITPLADEHGGGGAGLSLFLRDVTSRIDRNEDAPLGRQEVEYIDQVLSDAWVQARERYGPDPAAWLAQAQRKVVEKSLEYYWSLDRFGSLDRSQDLPMPATRSNDIGTIFAQPTQSYTQFVPLDDVDRALAILPIGSSERPDSKYRTATLKDWETGTLHPAPLSRAAVKRIQAESKLLSPR